MLSRTSHPAPDQVPAGRPLTGRTVLICIVGFFAVVFLANAILVREALRSFGGVETESAYKAGLAFKQDAAEASAQDARHWKVDAHVERTNLDVKAAGPDGMPLAGLELVAHLHHPSDRRFDEPIAARRVATGVWRGALDAPAGQWDLVIELYRGAKRQFRSVNRVVLK